MHTSGVIIFTYRDERRLFALIGIIIAAALLALLQIGAQRTGSVSPIATIVSSVFGIAETAIAATIRGTRNFGTTVLALPGPSNAKTPGYVSATNG